MFKYTYDPLYNNDYNRLDSTGATLQKETEKGNSRNAIVLPWNSTMEIIITGSAKLAGLVRRAFMLICNNDP